MQVLASLQSRVVLAAEMYHTASLMHDDVSLVAMNAVFSNLICKSTNNLMKRHCR